MSDEVGELIGLGIGLGAVAIGANMFANALDNSQKKKKRVKKPMFDFKCGNRKRMI